MTEIAIFVKAVEVLLELLSRQIDLGVSWFVELMGLCEMRIDQVLEVRV